MYLYNYMVLYVRLILGINEGEVQIILDMKGLKKDDAIFKKKILE